MAKTPERLTLPEPARGLHRALWSTIAHHIEDVSPADETDQVDIQAPSWSFGGGTILAARWDHRRSHDLDVQIDTSLPLHDLAHALVGDATISDEVEIGQPAPELIELRHDRASIDLFQKDVAIAAGHRMGIVEGLHAGVLPSAEILYGKLRDRGIVMPTRDLLDLAVASEIEPEALEIAANAFTEDDIADRIQAILRGPAPAEARHRTADALVHDSWRPIVPAMRDAASAAIRQGRYTGAHLALLPGHLPVCALTRADGSSTLVPFYDAGQAMADRGLEAHPLTRQLQEITTRMPPAPDTSDILHVWGTADTGSVESALADRPPPRRPEPGPTGATMPLAAVADRIRGGATARLNWFVHTSGDVDLRVRFNEDESWHVALRSRDSEAMSTALVDSGIPIEETTGLPVTGDRSEQIQRLTEIHRKGVRDWMAIYQARER